MLKELLQSENTREEKDLQKTNPKPLKKTEGNGNPLQYSCLENPMDGGA